VVSLTVRIHDVPGLNLGPDLTSSYSPLLYRLKLYLKPTWTYDIPFLGTASNSNIEI
jgi:hypothetical protein